MRTMHLLKHVCEIHGEQWRKFRADSEFLSWMTRFQTDARMVEGWMDSCPDLCLTQLATVQLAHQNASANQCNDQHLDVDQEMEHAAGIIKSYRTSPTRAWAAFPCKSKT